ncbi:hypothetical protein Acid345_3268 [Candidatus Koribacter versatilis Ellin345]|uniref:Response regulator receiver protein n=1 Tax=Koribacter versatilis (strain Ellin345) TaxID=204669 RepID=Q1ILI1_KORVE|nr:hypothetical protein [Candidatus Koribacter versatilis]ABF42269.1 hypothetical protein Acid345_3268 [Candidatus Koribacter versatilis Ellin345]
MNLLISSSPGNLECAKAIEELTQVRTVLCSDIRKAANIARNGEYTVAIVDRAAMYDDPSFIDEVFRNAPLAVPVLINTAIMNSDRVIAEVTAAISRVEREKQVAARQAGRALYNELKGEITGISVAAGLALQSQAAPMFVEEKLKDIEQLAGRMRSRFEFQ